MKRLYELKLNEIKIDDGFWNFYRSTVKNKMLPYQWEILNDRVDHAPKSHCIENFKIAAGLTKGEHYGQVFQDSDVAKWIEAVSYALSDHKIPELEEAVESVIDILEMAQQEDGYLDTYYTIKEPGKKWSNLREGHELYVAGHMIEAGVAYYENTGNRNLLDIVCKLADCICDNFGEEEGKIHGCPGHPEIELALIRLYRITERKRYLEIAKYFLDIRGTKIASDRFDAEQKAAGFQHIFKEFEHLGYDNIQAHKPVRQQTKATGHAVRALYLYSAMVDAGIETDDVTLLNAAKILFENVVNRQMFITGSVGAAADGECFTCDYDLPNNYNYSETCASVALMQFGIRLFRAEQNGKYIDIVEQALYNTVLSGMSMNGTEFFYVNPLEAVPAQLASNRTLHHVLPLRKKWMGVACCPPNIARTIMNLGSYIYAQDGDTLFVNLYVASKAKASFENGGAELEVRTNYPFGEQVILKLKVMPSTKMRLAFREPGWSHISSAVRTDKGENIKLSRKNGYLYTEYMPTEEVEITFKIPLCARWMCANPRIPFDAGKVALMRGPVVYCLEEADNGKNLSKIRIDPQNEVRTGKDIVHQNIHIPTIVASEYRVCDLEEEDYLYRQFREEKLEEFSIKAIPYCMWNNRGMGEMKVWIPVVRNNL